MSTSSFCPTYAAQAMTKCSRSVLAVGGMALAGDFEIAPFCALHRTLDGLAAHHYLTDPDMPERLGLVP